MTIKTKKNNYNWTFKIYIRGRYAMREKNSKVEELIKKEKECGIIVQEEESFTSEPCPSCGARKSVRIRSFYIYADEEPVNLMKCTVCGERFRLGSGVSGY